MAANANGYPRVLDRVGCLYGQGLEKRMERMEEYQEKFEQKIDRMTWALAGAALSFATAALMLGLNLWLRP